MRRTGLAIAGGAAAVGLTLGIAAIAAAGPSSSPEDPGVGADEAQPQADGSIHVPRDEGRSEADEAASLESLAKVTEDEAIAAATAVVPGSANSAELGNENGTVVYEVDVTAEDGSRTEVKIDAGDGTVLSTEGQGDESVGDRNDETDEVDGGNNEINQAGRHSNEVNETEGDNNETHEREVGEREGDQGNEAHQADEVDDD